MNDEIVIWPFLNASGKLTVKGHPAPDEGEPNLIRYRELGLIGPKPEEPEEPEASKKKNGSKKASGQK